MAAKLISDSHYMKVVIFNEIIADKLDPSIFVQLYKVFIYFFN